MGHVRYPNSGKENTNPWYLIALSRLKNNIALSLTFEIVSRKKTMSHSRRDERLEGCQHKNNCLVSNFYDKLKEGRKLVRKGFLV